MRIRRVAFVIAWFGVAVLIDRVREHQMAKPPATTKIVVAATDLPRAMAVRVDDLVGVARFIHPDDRVDIVLAPYHGNPKVILQNVKVLAIGEARSGAIASTVVTLRVTAEESVTLELAASRGHFLVTVRSWLDEEAGPATD